MQPTFKQRTLGTVGIVTIFAIAYSVLSAFGPEMRGGLFGLIIAPIVVLFLWIVIGILLACCILKRRDGRVRWGAGFGFGVLLILFVWGTATLMAIQESKNAAS